MNLVPFEFGGWLLLIVTMGFVIASFYQGMRPLLSACAGLCLIAAAGYYNLRAEQLSRHSPVIVQEGTVVNVGHNGGGRSLAYTTMQLRSADGQLAPVFDTRGIGLPEDSPPVHRGDRMRASFHAWDYAGDRPNHEREPFAMAILSGPANGWTYRDPPPGWTLTKVTAFVALAFFLGSLYRTYRRSSPRTLPTETGTNPSMRH